MLLGSGGGEGRGEGVGTLIMAAFRSIFSECNKASRRRVIMILETFIFFLIN
jgi:hypothetical protein